ncbi:MAG: hypothetical protein H7832_07660 [Magnetococcus sp. DMHC-6]
MFPKTPAITLYDPLGELLGAGDGHFTYTFDDAVKLAGHACPTVVSAFLMACKAIELLFPNETPQRGDIGIQVCGSMEDQVHGPITQVFTLLTGAAAKNGFQGLGGQFNRKDLLQFQLKEKPSSIFTFQRLSTGKSIRLQANLTAFPPSPIIGTLLPRILGGVASEEEQATFRTAWRQRVVNILQDAGGQTIWQV